MNETLKKNQDFRERVGPRIGLSLICDKQGPSLHVALETGLGLYAAQQAFGAVGASFQTHTCSHDSVFYIKEVKLGRGCELNREGC